MFGFVRDHFKVTILIYSLCELLEYRGKHICYAKDCPFLVTFIIFLRPADPGGDLCEDRGHKPL